MALRGIAAFETLVPTRPMGIRHCQSVIRDWKVSAVFGQRQMSLTQSQSAK